MPIRKSHSWGEVVRCPSPVVCCATDAEFGTASEGAEKSGGAVTLSGGNLWRATGCPAPASAGQPAVAVGIDALQISRTDGTTVLLAADSVVVRRRWLWGGPLRGSAVCISNSGIRGERSVLPRAHPGDGQWDALFVDPGMGIKARVMARARAKRADHLPHPGLRVERASGWSIEVGPREVVLVDGVRVSALRAPLRLDLAVDADRWTLHFASPTV